MAQRAHPILVIVIAVATAATALVAFLPGVSFAYRASSVRVALEVGATISALIAAFLVYGRLVRSGSRADLILCAGLVVVGLSNVGRAFAPSFNGDNNMVVWAPLVASTLVAGGAVVAAYAPAVRLRHPDRRLLYIAGFILAACAAVAAAAALGKRIPTGIPADLSPAMTKPPRVVGSTALVSLQVVAAVLFGAAAIGFANRARRTNDELMAWFALGAGLAGVTLLNYFLFPPVYSSWLFTGDIPRAAAYLAIVIGAFRQIAAYQRAALRTAVVEERQRIARDLHDGLAQDLAYLSLQGRRLGGDEEVGEIARTAQEALARSRAAIANLRLSDATLGAAVTSLARTLTARYGIRLELDVDERLDARANERDDLLRVLSETISNAAHHAKASEVRVAVARQSDRLVMRVADDGCGFDPDVNHGARGGTGLEGMRARVENLGGRLQVRSRPGEGTTLEVVLR